MGHRACVSPMLRITGTSSKASARDFEASLVSSVNAIVHADADLLATLAGKPVFAVGDRTAASAKAAGLAFVHSASGDRHSLAEMIDERMPVGSRLLYLVGRSHKVDLVRTLEAKGFPIQTIEIYRSIPIGELEDATRRLISARKIDAVLHYSQLSASAFCDTLANKHLTRELRALSHCCLSEDVAAPLRAVGAKVILVASRPEETSLFATLAQVHVFPRE